MSRLALFCILCLCTALAPAQENAQARCREALTDHLIIARARDDGMPREAILARARANEGLLGAERYANILRLIAEAYEADNVRLWFDTHRRRCLGEGES